MCVVERTNDERDEQFGQTKNDDTQHNKDKERRESNRSPAALLARFDGGCAVSASVLLLSLFVTSYSGNNWYCSNEQIEFVFGIPKRLTNLICIEIVGNTATFVRAVTQNIQRTKIRTKTVLAVVSIDDSVGNLSFEMLQTNNKKSTIARQTRSSANRQQFAPHNSFFDRFARNQSIHIHSAFLVREQTIVFILF
jgi:hypothetical protein